MFRVRVRVRVRLVLYTPSIPLNTKITEFNFGEEELDTETFFQNLLRDRRIEVDSDDD